MILTNARTHSPQGCSFFWLCSALGPGQKPSGIPHLARNASTFRESFSGSFADLSCSRAFHAVSLSAHGDAAQALYLRNAVSSIMETNTVVYRKDLPQFCTGHSC